MDFYELLEILIEGHSWNYEAKKGDALNLVNELREMNSFGTTVALTKSDQHEHLWDWRYGPNEMWQQCKICPEEQHRGPYGMWNKGLPR